MPASSTQAEIRDAVRGYLLTEVLPNEDPNNLRDDTPLISGGLLDSIGVTRLVTHLESKYSIRFESEDMTVGALDTVPMIVTVVSSKLGL